MIEPWDFLEKVSLNASYGKSPQEVKMFEVRITVDIVDVRYKNDERTVAHVGARSNLLDFCPSTQSLGTITDGFIETINDVQNDTRENRNSSDVAQAQELTPIKAARKPRTIKRGSRTKTRK
jgi:hypothetical protein